MPARRQGQPASLLLLARCEARLPRGGLLAWRGSDRLDLLLFGFLRFSITSLLALRHVGLLGLIDTEGEGAARQPRASGRPLESNSHAAVAAVAS